LFCFYHFTDSLPTALSLSYLARLGNLFYRFPLTPIPAFAVILSLVEQLIVPHLNSLYNRIKH
jgi:hypothetical protein